MSKSKTKLPPLTQQPIPYDEAKIQDKFWEAEEWDEFIPTGGWISDYVLSMRGIQAPTAFGIWGAIAALSAMLKRDVWLEWVPEPLYPNFYIFLVGPPKTGKSVTIRYVERLVKAAPNYIKNQGIAHLKMVNIQRSKATPEGLSLALTQRNLSWNENGEYGSLKTGSELTMLISELANLLGKQNYNAGLVSRLTDLYDCKDEDDELTIGRGAKKFKNIYVTMLGGTTRTSLETEVPIEVFGEGFMSRVVLVSQPIPTRAYPYPRWIPDGPSTNEIARRLAWVVQKAGEFTLAPDTRDAYNKWYQKFHKRLIKGADDKYAAMMNRYDIHLLKLALIIRVQRYEGGEVISLEDFEMARKLLERTIEKAEKAVENVGMTFYTKMYNRTKVILMRKKKVTRRTVLTSLSPYGATADIVWRVLEHLLQEDLITVSIDGVEKRGISTLGKEVYQWIGGVK